MFCPKCGKADQAPDSYCRQCGTFLPDLSKPFKPERPPQEHLKVNTVLNMMTIIVSFSLAAMLYIMLGFRSNRHPLIYVTAGLLIAMGGWHIQTFIRTRQLKKQWKRRDRHVENDVQMEKAATTGSLLVDTNFENVVPASVTDHTTRHLAEPHKRSS